MPLFEFKCRECGTTFEKIVPSSTTKVACKKCESPKVEKLLSVFAVGASSRSSAPVEPGPAAPVALHNAECAGWSRPILGVCDFGLSKRKRQFHSSPGLRASFRNLEPKI